MEKWKQKNPQELRSLAHQLRDFANAATMPVYAGKMNRAANELEQQADALECIAVYKPQAFVRSKQDTSRAV